LVLQIPRIANMLLGGAAELLSLASKDISEHILQVIEPYPD
jgi:hypothetical protein